MPYPIEEKLVVAVASSALFDLRESDLVFRQESVGAYRAHQREREDSPLGPGPAFPFLRALLSLNTAFPENPVEVILLSRNDGDSGLRVMNSIEHHRLKITRAAFLNGEDPWKYMEAFNACLFLSGNGIDVREAIKAGFPAGHFQPAARAFDMDAHELRLAFDFDGVLASDEAEQINQRDGLDLFHRHEEAHSEIPLAPGPLKTFLERIASLQEMEIRRQEEDPSYVRRIKVAIVTARNAPSHKRVVNTIRSWGLQIDRAFFLGGMEKARVLTVFQPHIFFDDQKVHVDGAAAVAPSVHIPFGELNEIAGSIEAGGRAEPA